MIEWPPKDPARLKLWLDEYLPALRDRRKNLLERIAEGKTVLHQPVTARLSQINIARTTTSDPTHDVVAMWSVEIPAMEAEVRRIDLILRQYERVKGALAEIPRKVIEGTYDLHLGIGEICGSAGISERTYYRYLQHAVEFMAERIGA
ncbi:MAG: hypothetical protein KGL39_17465 [Patescibacteria group bacterium]|nr:hypothetical protein [Patescibacteria group bacterium]